MKGKQSRYFVVAMVALSVVLSLTLGCRQIWNQEEATPPNPTDKQPVSSITITGPTEVQVGTTIALDATVSPSNAEQVVTWSSSRTANATVDTSGTVTGVAVGYTDIEATATDASGISALHRVSVVDDNTEVDETTSLALRAHDFRITLAEANAPLTEAEAITKAGALAWALDVGSSAALTIDATELTAIQTATVVNLYPLTFIATHSVSGDILRKTIQVDIRNELVEIEPAGDSLLASETVIPVNGSIRLQAVSSSGAVLTGFAWSIAAGGDPDSTGTAIEPTTGVVNAGSTHGVVTVEATKDGETVQHTVTVVDLIVTGAKWVESTESIDLYATIKPEVTDLSITPYSWSIEAAGQPSLSVQSTGGTKSNTATLKGQATLKLDVPVSVRVTAGTNGTGTTTAVLSKSYPVDVVDLVFTAPATLPSTLRVGESATTFGVAIQPQPTAGETLDVPAGNMVSWSQTPSAPSEKLKITPQADTTKADIIGEAVHTNVVITATYGAGSEDITTTHGVDVLAAGTKKITINGPMVVDIDFAEAPYASSPTGLYGDYAKPIELTAASTGTATVDLTGATWSWNAIDNGAEVSKENSSNEKATWKGVADGTVEVTITAIDGTTASHVVEVVESSFITFDLSGVTAETSGAHMGKYRLELPLVNNTSWLDYYKNWEHEVDWGDGSAVEILVSGDYNWSTNAFPKHYYTVNQEYTIRIVNKDVAKGLQAWSFGYASTKSGSSFWGERPVSQYSADELIDVKRYGSGKMGTGMFAYCTKLAEFSAQGSPKFGKTMQALLQGATAFNQDISDWDVSGVEIMSFLFKNATGYNNNGNPLVWGDRLGSVKYMNSMFNGAKKFNQDVSAWDVSSVIDMGAMFRFASDYRNNGVSLNVDDGAHASWDFSDGTKPKVSYMFNGSPMEHAANAHLKPKGL